MVLSFKYDVWITKKQKKDRYKEYTQPLSLSSWECYKIKQTKGYCFFCLEYMQEIGKIRSSFNSFLSLNRGI